MLFIDYYYDNVYKLLEKSNRVMKLKDAVRLSLMPEIDFEKYMPKRYRDKMILFDISGIEYVFIPTEKMMQNE
jgi:hypothetical protein